jgi:TraY domain
MAEKRKRRPGAGRPPRGEFKEKRAALMTRITTKTRAALERAAAKSGRSLSQEAEFRLDGSFAIERRNRPGLRALAMAITMVAEYVERATGKCWQDDAFTTQALQAGVEFLIRHFGASGDVFVPAPVTEAANRQRAEGLNSSVTPSRIGWDEAGYVIGLIERWHYLDIGEIPGPNAPSEWDIHSRLMRDLGRRS